MSYHPRSPFYPALGFQSLLLLIAMVWAVSSSRPLFAELVVTLNSTLLAVAGTLPLILFGYFYFRSRIPWVVSSRKELDGVLVRIFSGWTTSQFAIISAVAGLGEEALFRWGIQGVLTERIGPITAVLVGSALFGMCHFLNPVYAVITGFIGVYLGLIYALTQNLWIPVFIHALYDFVALTCLVAPSLRRDSMG